MILFDYNIFFLQKHGGISRYFIELCKQMDRNDYKYFIQASIHQNEYLQNSNLRKSSSLYLQTYPKYTRSIIKNLNKYLFEYQASKKKYKILHDTYYGSSNIRNSNIFKICSVYDFTHELFQKEYDFKTNFKKKALSTSDHFICISENTKKDLIKFYNINHNKISVVYLGGDHLPKSNYRYNDKPYILYVGYREKYKNFNTLLDAFHNSSILKNDFNIICYGSVPFNKDELEKISKYGLIGNVKHMTGSDQTLANLYANAKLHVITSKYEGFGITAIEAYNFNCPVIHTGLGSLSEITDHSSRFDGTIDDLQNLLEKCLYDNSLQLNLKKNINFYKEKYTWKNCYNNTINIYNNFLC
jgi:glycosyltransferase involved in cell wall biosynthesis